MLICVCICCGGAESRTQKETDEINKAMVYDTTLLRMCKETVAGLMRCVLCGSLSTHSVAFAGQLLAHTPLPDGDLQTMVLAFISYVSCCEYECSHASALL